MTGHLVEAVGLGGLLAWSMLTIGTILYDTRPGAPRPQVPATPKPVTGFTAAGVPWVAGPVPTDT